jgi:hypothetical protein
MMRNPGRGNEDKAAGRECTCQAYAKILIFASEAESFIEPADFNQRVTKE